MNFNIDELKKKIIYRSSYRGTKEMDNLMSSFTKKIINNLNREELVNLSNLLDIDDENLYKYHQGLVVNISIDDNRVTKLFREFNYNKN